MTECWTENIGEAARQLRAGDSLLLSGTVFTARDAAHKRIFELLDRGEELPFDISGSVIYYSGPTPTPEGRVIGSCGPTTSGRMDKFTPRLLDLGLAAVIGKGERSKQVIDAFIKNSAVYFSAVGGAGALLASCVRSVEEIAFPELGCESVKRLQIERMPLIVAIDCFCGNIYIDGRRKYLSKVEDMP